MEKFLIPIIFLSCALIPNYSVSQTMFKEIGALLLSSLFIIWWVWKHNKWLAALLLWLVIRMMLPPIQPRGMITLTNVFMASMIYLGIQYIKVDFKRLYQGIAITLFIQIATVFLQALNLFFCWNSMNDGGRVWGLFGNSNWSGCYIAMTIPIALHLTKQSKWYWLGLLGIPALILLKGNFALLGGIAGLLFYSYILCRDSIIRLKIDRYILAVILLAIAFVTIKPLYLNDTGRFDMWNRAYKFCTFNMTNSGGQDPAYQSHFVQGRGLGEAYNLLPMIQNKQYTDNWRQVHNEPLQILFEYGLLGFILFSGLVISTLRKVRVSNAFLVAGLVALLADSLGFFPFRTAPIGYMAIIYIGAIDAILL